MIETLMNNIAPIIFHAKNLPPTKIGNKEHYFAAGDKNTQDLVHEGHFLLYTCKSECVDVTFVVPRKD